MTLPRVLAFVAFLLTLPVTAVAGGQEPPDSSQVPPAPHQAWPSRAP
jgi:hypothetical protein